MWRKRKSVLACTLMHRERARDGHEKLQLCGCINREGGQGGEREGGKTGSEGEGDDEEGREGGRGRRRRGGRKGGVTEGRVRELREGGNGIRPERRGWKGIGKTQHACAAGLHATFAPLRDTVAALQPRFCAAVQTFPQAFRLMFCFLKNPIIYSV